MTKCKFKIKTFINTQINAFLICIIYIILQLNFVKTANNRKTNL